MRSSLLPARENLPVTIAPIQLLGFLPGIQLVGHCLNIFWIAFCTICWFLLPLLLNVSCAIPRHTRDWLLVSCRSTINVASTFCCGVIPAIPPPMPRIPHALQGVCCFTPPLARSIRSGSVIPAVALYLTCRPRFVYFQQLACCTKH